MGAHDEPELSASITVCWHTLAVATPLLYPKTTMDFTRAARRTLPSSPTESSNG